MQRNAHVVGDDVLRRCRVEANLLDFAVKTAVREGVDGEAYLLAFSDSANIGFGKARIDAHLGEILGDLDQRWRLQAGGDGLPQVDNPVDDHAGNRRADHRVTQVDLVLVSGGAGLCQLRFGGFAGLPGLVELLTRNVLLGKQRLHPCLVGLGQLKRSRDIIDVRRRLP